MSSTDGQQTPQGQVPMLRRIMILSPPTETPPMSKSQAVFGLPAMVVLHFKPLKLRQICLVLLEHLIHHLFDLRQR